MRHLINLTLILLMGLPMLAQTGFMSTGGSYEIFTRASDVGEKLNSFGITDTQFNSIKNGMYANPTFLYGNIYENGKEMVTGLPMRYNAYADDIEVKLKTTDENFQPLIKNDKLSVKTLTDLYIYLPDNGNKEKSGYVNVLVDGDNYKLYKKIVVSFKAAVKATTSYDNDTPPSFTQTEFYYLVHNGNMVEVPNRKSKIISMMEDEKPQMKTYIKKNKIDVRKESDLIKAVDYLDSL